MCPVWQGLALCGFDIWSSDDYAISRDFFMLSGNKDLSGPVRKMLEPEMIMAHVRGALSSLGRLRRPVGGEGPWSLCDDSPPRVQECLLRFLKGITCALQMQMAPSKGEGYMLQVLHVDDLPL